MSRRKQSNPKPLKWEEESWAEGATEGEGNPKKQRVADEEDASGNPGSPADSVGGASHTPDAESTDPLSPSSNNNNGESMKTFSKSEMASWAKRRLNKRPCSPNPSNRDEDAAFLHDLRRRQESLSSQSPELSHGPPLDLNGSPGPFSHQAILQMYNAGLPYLHLLNPALRNDAARFLCLPGNLPPELSAAAIASSAGGQLQQALAKPEKTLSETPRSGSVYMCEPCNIKFSSARTLEAHQTYYCSSRKEAGKEDEKSDLDGDVKMEVRDLTPSPAAPPRERVSSGEERELSIDESQVGGEADGHSINQSAGGGNSQSQSPSGLKSIKTGKLYSCNHCSYSADKKVSLNRHMRMHSGSVPTNQNSNDAAGYQPPLTPGGNINTKAIAEGVTAVDRYCFDCEIQFSSLKTYRVHKQHYCSTRHVLKTLAKCGIETPIPTGTSPHRSVTPGPQRKLSGAGSPVTPEGSPVPLPPLPQQPFVILPTNPPLIVPYCFIQGSSIVPGNLLPSQNALVVLPNGSVQTLPGTAMPMQMTFSLPSPSMGFGHTGLTHPANLSPNASHSVFNDPKDVIRRICNTNRNSTGSADTDSQQSQSRSQSHSHHSGSEKDAESVADMEVTSDNLPAIDLSLIKKEGEEEKENRAIAEVLAQRSASTPNHNQHGCRSTESSSHQHEMDFRHELNTNSPSSERHSIGSGSSHSQGDKRVPPRPSSIISSCSTSPAPNFHFEPKLNGFKLGHGLPPQPKNSKNERQAQTPDFAALGINKFKNSGGKMSPIATQLPGGAILTSASSQSLAELLLSNPPELNESLAKLNSQLVINSGQGVGSSAASIMAAAASLPPEVAMRLLDPTYLATLQHSLQVQQQQHMQAMKQSQQQASLKMGVWKCVECEIVFYKQENYLVHKEQYCAYRPTLLQNPNEAAGSVKGRESRRDNSISIKDPTSLLSSASSCSKSDGEASLSPPLAEGHGNGTIENSIKSPDIDIKPQLEPEPNSKSPSLDSQPSFTPPKVVSSNYLCQKCGVKYSSLDNLQTHQTFYCNKRNGADKPPTPVASPVNGNGVGEKSSPGLDTNNKVVVNKTITNFLDQPSFLKCGKCKLGIPEEQMTQHRGVCHGPVSGNGTSSPSLSSSAGWKCPSCDTYSPTMSAAQKHLETHPGIRAFKCLICGYRGNTLRGMRTHIRMHFDKRTSDLQEGEYISCITSTELDTAAQAATAMLNTGDPASPVNGNLTRRRNRVTLLG